ncbi:hypothetical protein TNCV_1575771 [Trichonephila clavipes]|nr:hypothetical protein TNCV_1575771 [Trichonephila clavipes]
MAPYRRKKPAPTKYTTDEEDMITYDVEEDELEQHRDLVQKEGKRLTVDGVVGLEDDNDEEEKSTPLTGKLIQGLQLCSKLENHFLINDPNSERASKLQRELQNCMSGYRELYTKIKESSSQSLITDYIVRKGRATQNENEVCENPWPLPQISIAETVSSDNEGDLEPLRKWCKPLSDSDND